MASIENAKISTSLSASSAANTSVVSERGWPHSRERLISPVQRHAFEGRGREAEIITGASARRVIPQADAVLHSRLSAIR